MKGLILALLIGIPVFVYGQEHLRFLDHPITGDLKEFVKKLNAEGYESVSNKYRFQGMQTKTVRGTFWKFSDSYVIVRKFKRSPDVSSVYIHPKNGYVLLNELIDVMDSKYGSHEEYTSYTNVNEINYSWNLPTGCISIFASTIYGQAFDILYQDYLEIIILNKVNQAIDSNL